MVQLDSYVTILANAGGLGMLAASCMKVMLPKGHCVCTCIYELCGVEHCIFNTLALGACIVSVFALRTLPFQKVMFFGAFGGALQHAAFEKRS